MDMSSRGRSARPVAIWLLVGVGMMVVQVLLGGITRLTGSGLSITEWKPILGTIPPMNHQQWEEAFNHYKQIGQYKYLNSHFSLTDFKFIYFWEWFHRVWARLIAIAFIVPFIIFIVQKRIRKEMISPMIVLFLLGALQGAIGWIMVMSGLSKEDLYVDHIRLAVHFIAALGLLAYTVWFALKLLVPREEITRNSSLASLSSLIVILLGIQLVYGAFMAGLKAGPYAPTWPTLNGQWWPPGITQIAGFRNLTDNPLMVQLIHRGLAYLLTILVFTWWFKAGNIAGSAFFRKTKWLPVVVILGQLVLGIFTVLNSPKSGVLLWLGVAHQFFAMLFLLVMVWILYIVRPSR